MPTEDTSEEKLDRIPKLNLENHESWFRRNKLKLKGKRVFYTCEKTVYQYAVLLTTEGVRELSLEEKHGKVQVPLNTEKEEKFAVDEATALTILFRSLTEEDQALLDEYETAYDLWHYLKDKYAETDPTTARKYRSLIQNFKFDGDMTIVTAWDTLKAYRRKLGNAHKSAGESYDEEALLLVLTGALPSAYANAIDMINIQENQSVDKKLKHLQEKERRIELLGEHGHVAYPKGRF